MTVNDILKCITEVAPLQWQESYDNAGLQVGDLNAEAHKALVCLDITEEIVDEAIAKDCDVIVSHHPLIFKGLKHLTPTNYIERAVMKAIKHDIAMLSMHTNLDNSHLGVSRILAERLGLKDLHVLQPLENQLKKVVVYAPLSAAETVRKAMFEAGAGCIGNYDSCSFNAQGQGTFKANGEAHPYVGEIRKVHFEDEVRIETVVPKHALNQVLAAMLKVHPYEEVAYDVFALENEFQQAGAGMVGELENPMEEIDFLQLVSVTLSSPCLRHSALTGRKIKKVALCGGSGSPFMGDALRQKADAYLTADIKYHDFFIPEGRILLVDGGHFETEQFTKELIRGLIQKKFPTFAAVIAETNTNSVHYFVRIIK
ncbi:MAG: Nif3-like dinuclear metal center hexameric protein [Bacteroidales bacterium]|nr:Nif3-like dinuclear metal center hexameric protein [Bacteroidales bacterium]